MVASVIGAALERVHELLLANTDGEVANYIPQLAAVEPDRFGIAVATVDGHVYRVGDADDQFTIQSISKPFVYGMALEDHGPEQVLRRVGVEPSGDTFNSIVMDERNNRPLNPMVNAGAIACTALVDGDNRTHRRDRVLDTLSQYAGRPLDVDQHVFESERRTGHRNRAIAYLELNAGMIAEPIDEHLDLYFEQCSVNVTAADLAVMAATLANGGVNPLTGVRALSIDNVSRVLTVMATCGMYDWSGEWMYRVGLPAKSGVAGGIIAVLPGQLGIGTFAPRLDEHGNSRRGVRACEELGRQFNLHLLDTTATVAPVERRRYDAATVASKRLRPAADRAILDAHGQEIVVLELQGDLYFATAERLVRSVEVLLDVATVVVLDTRRVGRATVTAARLLSDLRGAADRSGARLYITACADNVRVALLAADPDWPTDRMLPDTDSALERSEDDLLEARRGRPSPLDEEVALWNIDILRDLGDEDLAALEPLLQTERHEAGAEILREGEVADRLCFLVAGNATVCLDLAHTGRRTRRLRTFSAGTVFGEAALIQSGQRTATVIADEKATVRSLSSASLEHLAATRPALHAHLLAGVGRNLAEMLRRALSEIRALEA
ncbi:MAG: glutaminase [Actinomycetota bacterium]|nr:glutaminase [Actinomycetota bacterium]